MMVVYVQYVSTCLFSAGSIVCMHSYRHLPRLARHLARFVSLFFWVYPHAFSLCFYVCFYVDVSFKQSLVLLLNEGFMFWHTYVKESPSIRSRGAVR